MKTAVKHYKREWEEAQWLQLIQTAEKAIKVFNFAFKLVKLFSNLALFVTYIGLRWAWSIAKLALFAQPYNQLIKDEQWIYRQIK